jgi:hypothetical protein
VTRRSGPRVTVTPATFTMVSYDSATIADLVAEAAEWVGFGPADEIRIQIAEEQPLTDVVLVSDDPPSFAIDGGAFEDPRRPRQLDPVGVQTVAVRSLARIGDRRRPGFGDAPPEVDLTNAQADAWDAWALGRASRRGLEVNQQRWRYRFRNRHGFTDTADSVFERLWSTEDLTWADLAAACQQTSDVTSSREH